MRRTLPRVGGRGCPNIVCRQKSTGPGPAELGKLDQTVSGRGRGVNVKRRTVGSTPLIVA